MKIILLERVAKLGQMGQIVDVKPGYARNYLFPNQKAMRVTAENLKKFEAQKAQLEAHNLKKREEALYVAEKLEGAIFTTIRAASESGQLYGSVSTRDVAELAKESGFTIQRSQLQINNPIKTLGLHNLTVALHSEVEVVIVLNVARTLDEAEAQLRKNQEPAVEAEENATPAAEEEVSVEAEATNENE